tara:strand:- start:6900 stop:7391 length:492 start_codon:yes stop_codon:yes gene_type:complete
MRKSRKEYSKTCRENKKLSSYPLIYKIECKTTGLIYIGSTTQKLYDRKGKHMYDYRNRKGKISAHKVMDNNNWDIYEIEKVEDKSQLKIREQYWIDNTVCVNKYNTTRKVSGPESHKRYWYNHHENNLEKQKKKRAYQRTWGQPFHHRRYCDNLLLIDPYLFI